jgi:serine protease
MTVTLKIQFILAIAAFFTISALYAADAVVTPNNILHSPAGLQIKPSFGKGLSKPPIAGGHIMVQIAPETDTSTFLKRARGIGLRKLKQLRGTDWYTMGIDTPGLGVRQAATNAMGLPGVLRAVADPVVTINDQIPPSDPYYLDDLDPGVDCDIIEDPACQAEDLVDQWGLFKVMAETAWASGTGSAEVIVAIVDSGVDNDHDDLWANIWTNPGEIDSNGIDDDGNGFIDDVHGWDYSGSNVGGPDDDPSSEDNNPNILQGGQWVYDSTALPLGYRYDGDASVGDGIDNNLEYYYLYGLFTMDIGVFHGTTVAGVVSAMTNNINPESGLYEGFAGTCWHCTVMPLRIINAEGEAFGSDAAEAIRYAADNGAHIINASWGIAPGSATAAELVVLEEAIQYATGKGVIVVAAAGNSGVAGLHFPASMPETIAVGSSNWLDVRSDFSSYASPGGQEILDVVAPGEAIWNAGVISAYDAWVMNYWLLFPEFDWEPWHPGDDVYIGADGTSFAAPLVSGYLGLILSKNPCATPIQVRDILRNNAVDIGTSGYDTQTGFGRIEMVVPDLGCSTGGNQSPLAGFTYLANDLVVDFADQSSDTDGSIVAWNWDFGGDGMSTLQNPSHTFSSAGTYNITLTVTDDVGSTGTINQDVTVSAGTANTPPMASFSYVCNGRDCSFSDLSSDQDAGDNITAWSWDFGNGVTSNIQHPSLSYDSQGMYTVTLVVTDANSATGTVSTSFRAKNRGNTSGTAGGIDGGGDTGGTLEAERGKKKCSDGIDNDGDGLIDGSDPDCR